MTTIHTATLPDGQTATRTSLNRSYPFVIALGPEPRANVVDRLGEKLDRVEVATAHHKRILDYVAAGGELVAEPARQGEMFGKVRAPGLTGIDPYRGLGWTGRDGAFIGMAGDTIAEQVTAWFSGQAGAEDVAKIRTQIADTEAGPEWIGGWSAVTWASRPDLAEKAAAKYRGHGREVLILSTERRTK